MHRIESDISFCATHFETNKSNIPLITIYESRNIFLKNPKLSFHKYISSIYLEETKHYQPITNLNSHMCILISANYTHFHADNINLINNTKEPSQGTAVRLHYYHCARSRNLFQCILYVRGQLIDYKSICISLHTIIKLYETMCQFPHAYNGITPDETKCLSLANILNLKILFNYFKNNTCKNLYLIPYVCGVTTNVLIAHTMNGKQINKTVCDICHNGHKTVYAILYNGHNTRKKVFIVDR